jgi:hypothetical protein
VTPISRPVQLMRDYTVAANRVDAVKQALAESPEVDAAWTGQNLKLSAPVEVHDRVALAIRGGKPMTSRTPMAKSTPNKSEQRFTLKIERQPVGKVIDQLAAQLNLDVQWAGQLQEPTATSRNVLVSCDVRQVDLDGLLKALLAPAKLAFERDGLRVRIHAAE